MTIGFPAYAMAALLWLALIAFAVLGGADFGAGIWDLVSRRSEGDEGKRLRTAIVRAIGPIWEANGIWIVYFITGLWTVFPLVFATLTTVLFIPLVIGLLGIVMRGASFAYYTHFHGAVEQGRTQWEAAFGFASAISPFVLGAGLAAVASGEIHVRNGEPQASYIIPWTTPFALVCGAFAVALCMVIAAVYLTVELQALGDDVLVETFRRRGLVAGAATSLIGLIALGLAHFYAPGLFAGLLGKALPLLLAAMVVGVVTAFMLLRKHYMLARYSVAGMVTLVLVAWAFAQMPLLIPPDVTIDNGAAPAATVRDALLLSIVGVPIILGSFWLLLYIFKARRAGPKVTAAQFADSLRGPSPEEESDEANDKDAGGSHGQGQRAGKPKSTDGVVRVKGKRAGPATTDGKREAGSRLITVAEAVVALTLPVVVALVERTWYRRRLGRARSQARESATETDNLAKDAPFGVA